MSTRLTSHESVPVARRGSEKQLRMHSGELPEGGMRRVDLQGRLVALARVEGQVFAFADTCSHERASLSQGYLDGYTVECPLHGALFDVRDGRALSLPATAGVETFQVREERGELLLEAAVRPSKESIDE